MAITINQFTANRSLASDKDTSPLEITAQFDGEINLELTPTQKPTLELSNGGTAVFSGSGNDGKSLLFSYVVAENHNSTDELRVNGLFLDGSPLRDAADNRVSTKVSTANSKIVYGDSGSIEIQNSSQVTNSDLTSPIVKSVGYVEVSEVNEKDELEDFVDFTVNFSEHIFLSNGATPTLTFTDGVDPLVGVVAVYQAAGSSTNQLLFRLNVRDTPRVNDLQLDQLVLNSASLEDAAGNPASTALPDFDTGEIQLNQTIVDDPSAALPDIRIESIRYLGDESQVFLVGDVIDLVVRTTGAVDVETVQDQIPLLVLANGGQADLISGSGTNTLTFRYTVQSTDRDTDELKVLGVAENDAKFEGTNDQGVDLRIDDAVNLPVDAVLKVNAQSPYITSIFSESSVYSIGETVEFQVVFSEPVLMGSAGKPTLMLSNDATATYKSASPDRKTYFFSYTVKEGDDSSNSLDVVAFNANSASFSSVRDDTDTVSLGLGIADQKGIVVVDTSRPNGEISFDQELAAAGDQVGVTITFSEPVKDPSAAVEVANGRLGSLVPGDAADVSYSAVWKGIFIPTVGLDSAEALVTLDNSKVVDESGNQGVGLSSNSLTLDTLGPVATFTETVMGNGNRLVSIDFGEQVVGLEKSDLRFNNATALAPSGFNTVEAGKVYSLELVRVPEGDSKQLNFWIASDKISDSLGNLNTQTNTEYSSAWDITAPVIESIEPFVGGASVDERALKYKAGDIIYLDVTFSEKVNVDSTGGNPPFLSLSNGEKATYVRGSELSSQTLQFKYEVPVGESVDQLDVETFVRNNATIEDESGNAAKLSLSDGVNLSNWGVVTIDSASPTIVSISADEDTLYVKDDTVYITVQFSENVYLHPDTEDESPILSLSNGSVATFLAGDGASDGYGTSFLRFRYDVEAGDFDTTDLDVHALIANGAIIIDETGNEINARILSEYTRLSYRSDVSIDAAVPYFSTTSVTAGQYKAGDIIDIVLGWNKPVSIDTSLADPELKLSNGEIAVFNPQGSSANRLAFTYVVKSTDEESGDLSFELRSEKVDFKGVVAGEPADLTLPNNGALRDVDGNRVRIDLTPPTVESFTVLDNDGGSDLSAGETATVSITFDKAVKEVRPEFFTIDSGVLSNFETDDSNTWNATYTPNKGSQSGEREIAFDITKVSDLAGNFGEDESIAASFTLDTLRPTVEITSDVSGVAGGEINFVIRFSEPVSGFNESKVSLSDGSIDKFYASQSDESGLPIEFNVLVQPTDDSNDPIRIRVMENVAEDSAGNFNRASDVFVQQIDTTIPVIEAIDVEGGAYKLGDTVSFSVRFSEDVFLNGGDQNLFLHTNNVGQANYISGAGTDTWVFEYLIDGDSSPGLLSLNSLVDNTKSIVDIAGNVANPVINDELKESLPRVIIDTTGPEVESFSVVESSYNAAEADPEQIGKYNTDDVVWIKLKADEWLTVDTSAGRPTLELSNGGEAVYVSGSHSNTLLFRYDVSENDESSEGLSVNSVQMNGAVVSDHAGNALDGSALTSQTIVTGNNSAIIVDTDAPEIVSVGITEESFYPEGSKFEFTLKFASNISLQVGSANPQLTLSNGETADYSRGFETDTLTFEYEVPAGEGLVGEPTISGWNVDDVVFIDDEGNVVAHNLNESEQSIQVAVDSRADLNASINAVNDGYYKAGTTIAFEVQFDSEVFVDVSNAVAGGPVLALSNGQLAKYVWGDGTDTLRFEYTVAEGHINSDDLEVLGLAEQGAVLTDDAGNPALVEMVTDKRVYSTAVVDTQAPELTAAIDSFTANDDGEDVVKTLGTVSFTFEFSEVMDWILATDQSVDPSDAAAIAQLVADNEAEILDLFSVELTPANNAVAPRAYEDANGDLVAMPAPTDSGAGWNTGLVAEDFRFELDEQGEIDLTRFSVDVQIPDLTYADLTVSIKSDALGDFAQNLSDSVLSHTQRVDTQSFKMNPAIVLGLVVNSNAKIDLLDKTGKSMLEDGVVINIDPATGKASIVVSPSEAYPAGYRGPVILEVRDEDSDPDYIDEYTGEAKDLDTVIRAMFNVTGPGAVDVTVSPLTELAVAKFYEVNGAGTELDAASVDQYNSGIGAIFGLDDIASTTPVVTNAAAVSAETGLELDEYVDDGVLTAAEKYGQVLAMLSARDSISGSVATTLTELAEQIEPVTGIDGSTEFAIQQAGADMLVEALNASSSVESLDSVGVNRELIDLAYMDAAAASGFGLSLAEAETATLPIKGAQLGDKVFVRWGNVVVGVNDGEPNLFEVVIDASHIAEDGSVSVPVPLEIIELQGDANSIPVSFAIVDGETGTLDDADFSAPILVAVDIVPPVAAVTAPSQDAPLLVKGTIEGIRPGDNINVLLNNSSDDSFRYSLDTSFLEIIDGVVSIKADKAPPPGFSVDVSAITHNSADGTISFAWSLDLTQAIAVSHSVDSNGNKLPTFEVEDPRAVFEVQASTADLVGNPAASSSRNEFIIGSVDTILPGTAVNERAVMNELLDRLSARYGDSAVDTRDKIKTLAEAVMGLSALQTGTADAMVQAQQSLTVSTDGTIEPAVFAINIGGDALSLDLSAITNPSVNDLVDAIKAEPGYAAKNYTVVANDNDIDVVYKAYGPQPDSTVQSTLTETLSADEIVSTIAESGDAASFAVQSIAPAGTAVESGFSLSPGQVRLEFGDVVLAVDVSEGDLITDLLAQLQAADDYADLPFALSLSESGDSLVATWDRVGVITDTISLNRDYVQVTTSDLATFSSSPEGSSGVTTAQLEALDIQNIDDTQMGAINRVLADELANTLAQASIDFTQAALGAGESSVVTISFPERVGQLPDDVLDVVGGNFTAAEGAPIWSSTDGINWTATFTATSTINNTALRYETALDSDGVEVLDAAGNPKLQVITDTNSASGYAELGATDLMTVAVVEALVNKVTAASSLIHAYSSSADAAEPGLQAFADIGLDEVRTDNLSAVLDSLARVRDGFEVEGDLYAQLDSVASSYNQVFNTVYATGTQPSAAELEQAFETIGVVNLSATRSADQVALLQGVIASVANGQSAADQAALINTIAKLESYVATVEKVLSLADATDVNAVSISDAELTQLGFADLLADDDGNSRSSVLLKVLADQASSAAVVDYASLETLFETAVDAFDAVVTLTATAQANADTAAALAAVDAATFSEMGVEGVSDAAITGLTAVDMALAVKDALANTGNAVTSLAAVQTLVDSYTAVLTTAQSGTPSFDEADLVNIGVELTSTAGAQSAQVAILQDFLATLSLGDVARLEDLQAEVDLVDRVLTRAAGDTDIQVTDGEYVDLGIQGATSDNLPALQKVLSDLGSVDSVSTLADLQTKLNTTVQAFADITAIAGQGSADSSALTPTTFANMGVDALDDTRLAITLSALKSNSNATTLNAVQAAVDAINSLLDIADSHTGTVSADMLTAIGLTPVADQTAQTVQLTLMGDLLAARDEDAFSSVADINDLLSLTTALFANVAGLSDIAQSDLEELGVTDITANNLSTLQAVLDQQTDLTTVSDLASLQSLMATAISTHAQLLVVSGDADADVSAMDAQTFVDAGLDVTAGRESAVLSALKSTNETLTTSESIQAVFDSMETILDVAANDTGAISAADLTKVGVALRGDTSEANLQADLVSEIVADLSEGDVSTIAQISALTAVTNRLIGTVNDETDVALLEADMAVLGLSIDASNLRLFNEALGAETDLTNVEDLSEIAAIASTVMTAQTTALTKISAYIDDNGNAQPTVDDLRQAGVELSDGSRITEQLMPALLLQLRNASGNYTSFDDIQGLITAGSAQLLALASIAEYAQADGVDVAAPTLAQYQAAGIPDFGSPAETLEERHVAVANAILKHASIGTDAGEALATLTESNVRSLVDLVADPLPTVDSIDAISTDSSSADNAGGSATDFITSYIDGPQTITATLSAELKAWQLAEYRIDDGAWTQIADNFITGTAIEFGSTAFNADATYTLEIRVKDLSGETSTAATQDIIVDTTDPSAPAVVIPVEISDDAASIIEATAPEGVITLQGGQGETLKVTLTSTAAGSTSVTKTLSANDGSAQKLILTSGDVNNLGTGTISVSVTSTDLAGKQSTNSDIASFDLDADRPNPPTLSQTLNVFTVVGESGATLTLLNGSTDITDSFTVVESAAGTYTVTAIADAFDGQETLSITATLTDTAGNIGYASNTIAGAGILDTTAPAAPVLTAVANSGDADFDESFTVTENADVVVSVNGTDLTPSELLAHFTKTTNAGVDTYTAVNAKFAGTEAISVTAGFTDSFNNTTEVTVALQEVKPVTPTQAITFDDLSYDLSGVTQNESDFIVNQTSGLTVNATLSAELAAGHKLMYFNGAGQWVDISSSVTGTAVAYQDATLTSSAAISMKIRNALGEETAPSGQAVVIDTSVPDAPTLVINGSVTGALTETEITDLNTDDGTDPTNGIYNFAAEAGSTYTLTFTNGSNSVEKTGTATGDGQFEQLTSSDLTQLSDGTISVSLTTTDKAGNTSAAVTDSFVLDTTPPAEPDAVLTTDSGTAGDNLTNSAAITAPTNAETGAVVEYRVLDADNSDAVLTDWATSYAPPTADGNYKVQIRQTDAAGNTSTVKTVAFELDATIPVPDAVITSDSGTNSTDGITDDASITAPTNTGTDTLRYRILNAADNSVVADWASSYTAPTNDGSYKVEVEHSDTAGNTATQTLNLTLDTAVTITVAVAAGTYGVGDSVVLTLTASGGETGISFSTAKFNGRTLEGVTDNGDGTYSATYVVSAGDPDVAAGGDVTVDFQFTDLGGNSDTLTTVTLANSVAITPAALALEAFDEFINPGAPDSLDLGSFFLVKPVVVDGGKTFYLYSSDGSSLASPNLSTIKSLFSQDVNGAQGTAINGTYRYGTHDGISLKLVELGSSSNFNYSAISGNEVNPNLDGLAAIFDAYDGEPDAWADHVDGYYAFKTDGNDSVWNDEDYEHKVGTTWINEAGNTASNFGDVYVGGSATYSSSRGPLILEVTNPQALLSSASSIEISLGSYLALSVSTYNDGASDLPLTQELVALANEIVSGITGTVTAAAIQTALNAAHAKLTAMQVVLNYIDDQGNTAPDADDYNAIGLGRTVADSEVAALNAAAVSAGTSAADTPADLAAFLPIPSVTIDAISEDTSATPPMADLNVSLSTNPNDPSGYVLIDVSSVQVGDFLTLTFNGVSYTTGFAVPAPTAISSSNTLQLQILHTLRGGYSEPAALTEWKSAVGIAQFYGTGSGSDLLIKVAPVAGAADLSAMAVKAGVPTTPDFITSDDDGLTITATLDAALAAGQRLEYSTDGTNWTDISDSVTGTAVSYDASSLTSTASVQMRVVNTAGTAGTADSQVITIDAAAPVVIISSSDTTNDVTPTVSGTAEAGATVTAVIAGATYEVISTDGTWSIDTATATPVSGSLALDTSGDNSISVTAVDVAGNVSTSATTQTLVIDTVAPEIAPSGLVQLDAYGLEDVPGSGKPLIASTAFADGSFVEVWVTKRDSDKGVVAQRFNADGSKDGGIIELAASASNIGNYGLQVLATKPTGEFVVSWGEYQKKIVQPVNADDSLGTATEIAVAGHGGLQSLATVNNDGDFVLVYGDNTQQNTLFTTRVNAQLFDVDGNAVGGAILVDSHQFSSGTSQPQATDAKVVSLNKTNGLFGVSWSLENTDDESLSSVYWGTFITDGSAITSSANAAVEFKTASEDRDYNLDPQAVSLGNGAAAMVWRAIDATTNLWTVYVQRIEANHALTAQIIKLDSSQFGFLDIDNIPSVQSLASGKFVVSWINTDGGGDNSIFVQLFNADGTKSGAEVVLEGTQSSTQTDKQVSIAEIGNSGEFVISWTGQNSSNYSNSSVYVQRFNADGSINGMVIQLDGSNSDNEDQMSNLVGLGADGDFAVAFGGDNGSNYDIYVQYFDANGDPLSNTASFSFGEHLSSLELGSSADLSVAIAGIDDSGVVTLTLNSQSYTGTISSGIASITVPSVDLIALPEGSNVYQINATDSAGNTAPTVSGSFEKVRTAEFDEIITGTNTSYTDTDAAVDDSGVNADGTPDVVIKLNDIAENDALELVVDGVVVSTHTVTSSDLTSGEVTFSGVDVASNDASSDRSVTLGLKVTHITETQEVDTWEFNW